MGTSKTLPQTKYNAEKDTGECPITSTGAIHFSFLDLVLWGYVLSTITFLIPKTLFFYDV
jgi:hypothetical protein